MYIKTSLTKKSSKRCLLAYYSLTSINSIVIICFLTLPLFVIYGILTEINFYEDFDAKLINYLGLLLAILFFILGLIFLFINWSTKKKLIKLAEKSNDCEITIDSLNIYFSHENKKIKLTWKDIKQFVFYEDCLFLSKTSDKLVLEYYIDLQYLSETDKKELKKNLNLMRYSNIKNSNN